jgi:transposase
LSKSTIGRIWRDFGLKPHQSDTFKLSTDPLFVEKVVDVVGLYHNPPEKAVVLCVDEKSQIQALDRSQPVLPMMPGMSERRTHDYARNGITSLFAAFNIEDGTVIGELHRQHRAAEFKKFLITIDKTVPAELDVHLICDNYGTHKTPAIKTWLAKHPRFHMHFTPTGSSWINQVERWFGFLTDQMIKRGAHKNVQALEKDIRDWVADWNTRPRPFIWTKTAEEILESLARYCRRISGAAPSAVTTKVHRACDTVVMSGAGTPACWWLVRVRACSRCWASRTGGRSRPSRRFGSVTAADPGSRRRMRAELCRGWARLIVESVISVGRGDGSVGPPVDIGPVRAGAARRGRMADPRTRWDPHRVLGRAPRLPRVACEGHGRGRDEGQASRAGRDADR